MHVVPARIRCIQYDETRQHWLENYMQAPEINAELPKPRTARQDWMAVLARASALQLEQILERAGGPPPFVIMKPAETGTLMLEGRAGGSGRRFNAGEATVTRCVVRLASGTLGYAYVLGTDRKKALAAAVLDGLLQCPNTGPALATTAIAPLAAAQRQAREIASRKAAATKVEFFTLVRGSD